MDAGVNDRLETKGLAASIDQTDTLIQQVAAQADGTAGPWRHAASHARNSGRPQQARALLQAALDRFPTDPGLLIDHAELALWQRDWPEADRRWAAVVETCPDLQAGPVGQARVAHAQGKLVEARHLLLLALERFPTSNGALHVLASVAETAKDWPAAERWWRTWLAMERGAPWWDYVRLANVLREQGRFGQADHTLIHQFERFPDQPGLFLAYARLAEQASNWREAELRYKDFIARFPASDDGYAGALRVREAEDKLDDGWRDLKRAAAALPDDPAALRQIGHLAEARGQWPTAERVWRKILGQEPADVSVQVNLANALREQRRSEEAGSLLREVLARSANRPDVLATIVRQISRPHGFMPADHLAQLEHDVVAAATRSDAGADIMLASALLARERQDWAAYQQRLAAGARAHPSDGQIRVALSEARELHPLEHDATPAATQVPAAAAGLSDVDLVGCFESLGGGRGIDKYDGSSGGCEFGLFQRHFGAEPLGLLRWATIEPDDLDRALANELAGLGEEDSTELHAIRSYDWQVVESRYRIEMDHTHLDRSKIGKDDAKKMVCKRFRFLRRKLLDDMATGDKILTYRLADASATSAQIESLAQRVNKYGNNHFMFVTRSTTLPQPYTLDVARKGLLIASIRHEPGAQGRREDWLSLCRAAHTMIGG